MNDLRDPRAHVRAAACDRAVEDLRRSGVSVEARELEPLLDDAAPVVIDGTPKMIVEVRVPALLALQALDRAAGTKRPARDVLIRLAMPADELEQLAVGLPPADIQARAAQHADLSADDARLVAMYELLDEAGRIARTPDRTSPEDGLTDLQRSLHDKSRARPRPLPHLVVEGDVVLGWIYREGTRWVFDFVGSPESERARDYLREVSRIERNGVPRIIRDATGEPVLEPGGAFQFDGVIPMTGDAVEVLGTFEAFARCDYPRSRIQKA